MSKVLLFCFLAFSSNFVFANSEFTPKEAISYLNKTYEEAKIEIIKKGYKFSEKHENFYSFQKIKGGNKYICTLIIKKGKVELISTNEHYEDYSSVLNKIQAEGFTFDQGAKVAFPSGDKTEFNKVPTSPIASSMIKFDKQKKFTCYIICPYNLKNGTNLISINYSIYTSE